MSSVFPRSILCVHPNKELYGSDRTFLQAVRAFRARWPAAAITALIPGDGLLAGELRREGVNVRFDNLFALRRSHLADLPRRLWALRRRIAAAAAQMREHDLVYINTIVLLDFLLASRGRKGATLIHVHELPVGRARRAFAALLGLSRGRVIFISDAVRRAFGANSARACIVWNGTRPFTAPALSAAPRPLRVLVIGRFNAWKGQGVLLDALALMPPAQRTRFEVRIVGSAFEGQDHFTAAITDAIAAHALGGLVDVQPFAVKPDAHYRWADVVVVPSIKPEPFGLVAIEGMAAGRAVIASDHGGLSEIVVDDETGTLVPPADAAALARALNRYADDRALLQRHGAAGQQRFEAEFDERIHMAHLADAAASALNETWAAHVRRAAHA